MSGGDWSLPRWLLSDPGYLHLYAKRPRGLPDTQDTVSKETSISVMLFEGFFLWYRVLSLRIWALNYQL